jgi:hypothetical protein
MKGNDMTTERPLIRKQMVEQAVSQAGPPVTIENVAKFLPPAFDLDNIDLAPFVDLETVAEAPTVEPFDWGALGARVERLQANAQQPQAEAEPEPPATPDAIEAATRRRIAADSLVANARVAVIAASNVEREARIKLAKAVTQFQSGFAPVTPEQLRRDYVKEQAAIRQAQKDGTLPVPPRGAVGKSMIDRIAAAQRGGSLMGNFRRGASPVRGMPNYDPRKGPTVKLPSQR